VQRRASYLRDSSGFDDTMWICLHAECNGDADEEAEYVYFFYLDETGVSSNRRIDLGEHLLEHRFEHRFEHQLEHLLRYLHTSAHADTILPLCR
jgi:hypothetical protein